MPNVFKELYKVKKKKKKKVHGPWSKGPFKLG